MTFLRGLVARGALARGFVDRAPDFRGALPPVSSSTPPPPVAVVKPDLSAWSVWWPMLEGSGLTTANAGLLGTSAAYTGTLASRSGGGLPEWAIDPAGGGTCIVVGDPVGTTDAIQSGSTSGNWVRDAQNVTFAVVCTASALQNSATIFGSYDNDAGPASSRTGLRILHLTGGLIQVITGYGPTAPNSSGITAALADFGVVDDVPFMICWKKYGTTYERLYINGQFAASNTYTPLPARLGETAVLGSAFGHYALNASTATISAGLGWHGKIWWGGVNLSSESTIGAADAAAAALFALTGLPA